MSTRITMPSKLDPSRGTSATIISLTVLSPSNHKSVNGGTCRACQHALGEARPIGIAKVIFVTKCTRFIRLCNNCLVELGCVDNKT